MEEKKYVKSDREDRGEGRDYREKGNKKYTRRYCKYTEAKIEFLDYKNIDMLRHTLSERYRIMPRRLTGNSKKWQERAELAIKRARHMALIPYIVDRKKVTEFMFKY